MAQMFRFRVQLNCTILFLLLAVASVQGQTKRFSTSTGPETMGHDVDPDYGNRRDFFMVSPAMWVERFADGYIKAFTVIGPTQVSAAVVYSAGGPGGSVAGTIIRADAGLDYFVPDEIQLGMFLAYRPGGSGAFLRSSAIVALEPDSDSSRMYVRIGVDMTKVKNALFDAIPTLIDERDDPNKDDYRYRFDAIIDDQHRRAEIVNGRIHIYQVYQGDFETKCTICFGCHLRPLFVQAEVNFLPAMVQDTSGSWIIAPTDSNVNLTLLPGSDTGCTIINKDATSRINDALGRQGLKDKASDALKKAAVPVAVADTWSGLQGPFVRSSDGQTFCFYPQLQALWAGGLQGDFNAASFEISLKGGPRIVTADTCAPAPSNSFQLFDGSQPGGQSQVVFDLLIPYTNLRKAILQSPTAQQSGFTDVGIEAHQAYLSMKLTQATGVAVPVNAIPVIGIPGEPGDVSLVLVFSDVPGTTGSVASALNGSTIMSLNDQVIRVKKALLGTLTSGHVQVTISDDALSSAVITCENDGLHVYVKLAMTAFGSYVK